MSRRQLTRAALVSLSLACVPLANVAAETRHFAISWFAQATYSNDHDCSRGVHPAVEEVYLRYAAKLGATPQQVAEWRRKIMNGDEVRDLDELIMNRGRIDGKPVNPYTHPAAVVDLSLPGLDGKDGFGFDLDGKGPDQPGSFQDPETKQRGVDHNLYRALGCTRAFRGSLDSRPTYWAWAWGQLKDSQPAWLITVDGADLSKDGPVTIAIERAYEYLRSNSDGSPRLDMAYRVDPDLRSRNKFNGELRNGVVTITEHGNLRLLQNPLVSPEFKLSNLHLRLELKPDRTARGFMAGYQPWRPIYWGIAGVGFGGEQQVTGDVPGFYYLLKRYADADPDPVTGQNESISATYYIEAVPAFVKPAEAPAQQVSRR
ncbi:hypothetical protein [Steroidobacter cummioxidans]|uniref:hypothetical protein n=1 Tax=Steroidobacter cummioxidans TaxID=1803913 RepID=UPI000E30C828|nr:hypothetical protein [Steroidobacter cummioxidans]